MLRGESEKGQSVALRPFLLSTLDVQVIELWFLVLIYKTKRIIVDIAGVCIFNDL